MITALDSFMHEFGNGGFNWAVHHETTKPNVFTVEYHWVNTHIDTFHFDWHGMWGEVNA